MITLEDIDDMYARVVHGDDGLSQDDMDLLREAARRGVEADHELQNAFEDAVTRAERAEALAGQLKLQAQIHAQEAQTANSTIAEIYQLCTGATGEPGNWHGAEPVRQALAAAVAREVATAQVCIAGKHQRDGENERPICERRAQDAIRARAEQGEKI
jgi:hypothetical protein